VTRAALECIREDLERMVDLTVEPSTGHWAILTGIQIHSPSGVDYVSPGSTYAIVDGERRDLSLSWLSGHRP